MGYQPYAAPPGMPGMEPPEAQSIKSMLHIGRILAIIFGIILLLIGLADAALVAYYVSVCSTFIGFDAYCGAAIGFYLIGPIVILIFGAIDLVIYMKLKSIETLVNNRQYEQAKAQTLMWMILGFILGGVIIGIVLLVAYLKFDPLINWSRSGGAPPAAYAAPPVYAAPPAAYPAAQPPAPPAAAPAPMAAPAPAAANAPTTPCTRCGRPAVWVAQYNRWYCPAEQQYL